MKKYRFIPIILLAFFIVPNQGLAQVEQGASLVLLRMINQARAHPLDTIRSLSIDETAARLSLGTDQWIIDEGLPPLAWNEKLAGPALAHGHDMITRVYYSSQSPDGDMPGDRIKAAGYNPISEGELLGALAFSGVVEPEEALNLVFENWVRDELNPARQGERHIFNGSFREIGVAFIGAILSLGNDIPPNVFVAVADFAEPSEVRNYVVGNVFRDLNENGIMEPEEAVAGATVLIKSLVPSGTISVISGGTGEYQALLSRWFFVVSVMQGPTPLLTDVLGSVGDENILLDLRVP